MLPAVKEKPTIAIVGPGRLGKALAVALKRAGHRITEIIAPERAPSQHAARELARLVNAEAITPALAVLDAKVIWLSVPDREIARVANELAARVSWKGKIAVHASGALGSEEVDVLRQGGAAVASAHPFMTFVSRSVPSLEGVPFAMEGDRIAMGVVRRLVLAMGAVPYRIRREHKAMYHAWGAFTSPLLVSLLVTAEQAAESIGFSRTLARKWAVPIVRQTVTNYERLGAEDAFSGPIIRGDVAVVRKHLLALKGNSEALAVYVALARAAMKALPAGNRKELEKALTEG